MPPVFVRTVVAGSGGYAEFPAVPSRSPRMHVETPTHHAMQLRRTEPFMARKRKGEGASRVTPKGSHSRSGTGSHRQRTDDATLAELRMLSIEAVDCIEHCNSADLDGAEESVSCMIGIFTTSNWNADGVSAGRALTHAETIGGPAGAVIAAGIAAYGERGLRKRGSTRIAALRRRRCRRACLGHVAGGRRALASSEDP